MSLKNLLQLRNVLKQRLVKFTPVTLIKTGGNSSNDGGDWGKHKKMAAAALLGSVLVGAAISDKLDPQKSKNNKQDSGGPTFIEAGEMRPDLPTYRAEEVSKHDTKSSFWVTYKYGVYDITKFLPSHPGGEQILNSAGLSIEPFWNVYGMHKTQDIYKLLESYRIGNLHADDVAEHSEDTLWAREPARDPRLLVRAPRPFNAEAPPALLADQLDTPNELFYVRQHMPVPELDPDQHKLTLRVKTESETKTVSLSLAELQRFPRVALRAALMCAGNRRSEMDKVKPVKGISWTSGAISNAVWEGVRLRDVLVHYGVDLENTEGKHIIFTGADVDATGVNFSTSIPLHMVAEAGSGVLLATHMNAAPLPPDHGRPLRVVVPGAPAVRSVKWLESITISTEESESHWHRKDYRSFSPSVTWATADWERAPPLYSVPVTSVTCRPAHGDTVPVVDGCVHVKGYAYSGGGASIVRVDVRAGAAWAAARVVSADAAPPGRHYAWTLWDARVPVPDGQDEVEICVKATDSNFNTQPERFDDIWNIRGVFANAYHRITVKLAR